MVVVVGPWSCSRGRGAAQSWCRGSRGVVNRGVVACGAWYLPTTTYYYYLLLPTTTTTYYYPVVVVVLDLLIKSSKNI